MKKEDALVNIQDEVRTLTSGLPLSCAMNIIVLLESCWKQYVTVLVIFLTKTLQRCERQNVYHLPGCWSSQTATKCLLKSYCVIARMREIDVHYNKLLIMVRYGYGSRGCVKIVSLT